MAERASRPKEPTNQRTVTISLDVNREFHNGKKAEGGATVVIRNGVVDTSATEIPTDPSLLKELRKLVNETEPFLPWLWLAMGGGTEE